MRNAVKAEIISGSSTKEGLLYFKVIDDAELVKEYVIRKKLTIGSTIFLDIDTKEKKSYPQLKTFFLLVNLYDDFLCDMQEGYISNIEGVEDYFLLKFGVVYQKKRKSGETVLIAKRLSRYEMKELSDMLSKMFDYMNRLFAEYHYECKRFAEMIKQFNSQEIKNDADELF